MVMSTQQKKNSLYYYLLRTLEHFQKIRCLMNMYDDVVVTYIQTYNTFTQNLYVY